MWTKEELRAKHAALLQEYRTVQAQIARARRDTACCEAARLGAQQAAQIFYGVSDLALVGAEELERTHPDAPPLAELVALYRDHSPGGAQATVVLTAKTAADDALRARLAALEAVRNLALGLYNLGLPQVSPAPTAAVRAESKPPA